MDISKNRLFRPACMTLAVLLPAVVSHAQTDLQSLGARWQQWALSVPTGLNPMLGADPEYEDLGKCVNGEHGDIWFLAGIFGSGTASRTCDVPEGKQVFFPVVNSVNFNAPKVCGQGPADLTEADLRAASAFFINGVTNMTATLDAKPIVAIQRLQSPVFSVALPPSNVFDSPCGRLDVPGGIYSPAVDDGFYVLLDPLAKGIHTLHLHAENPSQNFSIDVQYKLRVGSQLQDRPK
jgi:hypothetical protein